MSDLTSLPCWNEFEDYSITQDQSSTRELVWYFVIVINIICANIHISLLHTVVIHGQDFFHYFHCLHRTLRKEVPNLCIFCAYVTLIKNKDAKWCQFFLLSTSFLQWTLPFIAKNKKENLRYTMTKNQLKLSQKSQRWGIFVVSFIPNRQETCDWTKDTSPFAFRMWRKWVFFWKQKTDGLNLLATQSIRKKIHALVISNLAKFKILNSGSHYLVLKVVPFTHLFSLIVSLLEVHRSIIWLEKNLTTALVSDGLAYLAL